MTSALSLGLNKDKSCTPVTPVNWRVREGRLAFLTHNYLPLRLATELLLSSPRHRCLFDALGGGIHCFDWSVSEKQHLRLQVTALCFSL